MAEDLDFFEEISTQEQPEKLVQIRFVTKIEDPSLKVPDAPIAVPVTFARYALSELVNHLLNLEQPKMFDFLTKNILLRDTIAEYMQRNNLSLTDFVLELEYVEILPKPDLKKGIDGEDWISCLVGGLEVDVSKSEKPSLVFLSGSYDHRVRMWSSEGQSLLSFTPHTSPITALASTKKQTSKSKFSVVTGAKDSTIKAWEVDGANNSYNEDSVQTFVGHTDAITCIAIDPSVKDSSSLLRFCSSSWDKTILLWKPYHDYIEHDSNESVKRRRIQTEKHSPQQQLKGHTQVVQKIQWMDSFSLVSGSSDHTIRLWDVASGVCTSTLHGNEVVTSLSHSQNNGLIASSHPDRIVRLWDPRSQEKEFIKKKLRSHTRWVTDVSWHPTSPNLLISCSHDKTVKVWDIRSDFALHTLTSHNDKVLCVDWNGPSTFLSGSADCRIYIHSLNATSIK